MGSTSSNEKMCWRKVDNSCHATDGSYCLVHFSQEDDSLDNSIKLPLSLTDLLQIEKILLIKKLFWFLFFCEIGIEQKYNLLST